MTQRRSRRRVRISRSDELAGKLARSQHIDPSSKLWLTSYRYNAPRLEMVSSVHEVLLRLSQSQSQCTCSNHI